MRANTWDEEVAVLPVAALMIISIVAGLIAWAIARPVLRRPAGRQPTRAVADEVRAHTAVRRFVHSRLDTEVLTGLALTLAVFMLCLAGVVIALLVVLIHHSQPLADLDKGPPAGRSTTPVRPRAASWTRSPPWHRRAG